MNPGANRLLGLIIGSVLLFGCGEPLQLAESPQLPQTPLITLPTSTGAVPTAIQSPVVSATDVIASPTVAPSPTLVTNPTPSPAVIIVVPTTPPLTSEERWLARQIKRETFEAPRIYRARQPVVLLWFDPQTSQTLEIGRISGDIPAVAQFRLRGSEDRAIAVLYRIDVDFGLTAISEALRTRMAAAGYTQTVEAYVLLSDGIEEPAQ